MLSLIYALGPLIKKWWIHDLDFTGARYVQDPTTKEIAMHQEEFVEKMKPTRPVHGADDELLPLERVSDIRAVVGDGNWLCTNSRPDLSVQVSIFQSDFPRPTNRHARVAAAMGRRAKQQADLHLCCQKIPLERLGVFIHTDSGHKNR